MSETTKFNVIFRGDIVLGHNLVDVKARLQQLFKADAAKIDALFTGRPVPLKKNLDEASAKKYHHVLTQAGAEVSLVPVRQAEPAGIKAAEKTPAAAPAAQTPTAQTPTGLTLAPAGTDVLSASERKEFVAANIDVSSMTLRESEGNLIDASEVVLDAITPVQVPEYDVAEAGSALVRDDEKNALPLLELDVADWDLSEAGEDLIKDAERVVTEKIEVQDLQVDLAPVGSDLGQLKKVIKPVNPDISKLKLVDE